jgi:hypothetical protein
MNRFVGMQRIPQHVEGENWARMPKVGHRGQPGGRLRGLSRTTLLELNDAGLIKVVAIRKPGAQKAIRLVYLPSLDAYLEGLATDAIK